MVASKRSRANIACIAFIASALLATAACGTPNTPAGDPNVPANPTSQPSASPQESDPVAAAPIEGDRAMDGNLYLEGVPLVKEKETFTMMVDDNGDPSEMVIYQMLEEQTNVHVDVKAFPYDIAREKKTIALTSGEYTDVIGGWILGEKEILTLGMGEGVFIPIDALIEERAPKIREILDVPGVRQAMTTPDGHIYTIPYVSGTPEVNYSPYINIRWLERVGKDMPTTTEEFKDVLMAFREQDANGNGDATDEIPFSADPVNMNLGQLAGWFGNTFSNGRESIVSGYTMRDGQLVFAANTEEYRQFIRYMNDLYECGLIDNELFTQNGDQQKAKGRAGLLGVSIAYGSGDFTELKPNAQKEDFDYMPLPVLRGPGVNQPNFERGSLGTTVFKTQVVITDKCKNPATVLRWFDNLFQLENSIQALSGPVGISLKKVGEDQYQTIDRSDVPEAERKKYEWANLFTQSLPKYIPAGYRTLPADGVPQGFDEKGNTDALYRPFLTEMIPSSWATEEDAARMSILSTDVRTYMNQKQAEWITGQADIEKEWDGYVEHLQKLGLDELTQIQRRSMGL